MPLLPSLSSIAGWRTTTQCIPIPGWATAHPGSTSFPNPLRVRFDGVNSTVDCRVLERGLGNAGLQIVADRLPRGAAEIGEGADMRGNPVRQLLAPDRFGIGEVGSAEHGDEDLHRHD